MTEMIGHIAETAGHDEPKTRSVTMDRNPRSRCRNHRSRWSEIRNFDFGYWNGAPQDQQIAYPQGGEEVAFAGLTPQQHIFQCRLPQPALHTVLRMQLGPILPLPMRLDTLVFDLKAMTLSCAWRIQVAAQFGARVLELRKGPAPT